jgi:nicotinate phosphoribosyltransferase
MIEKKNLVLFTDLYELTMAQSYWKTKNVLATFELFVRKLPQNRGYLIAAGLEDVCNYLQNFKFERDDLEYLKEKGFEEKFLKFLKKLKFTGDVWALEEGELVFPNEPIVRVTAPIIQAQIFETFMLNAINFQTLIATKASRVVEAAKGRAVVDFGSRRAHGIDAGLKAARASYIGGCIGTSNVLAGKLYGIPIFGTMAHSYIQAFPNEKEAFRNWIRCWGANTILLIDTYDTLKGAKNAIEVVEELTGKKGLSGVRIDSGDLLTLSKKVRKILNGAGFKSTKIFASGGLNEYNIQELLRKGAPIDAFGVGTSLVTSDDSPGMDTAYKLMEVEENGKMQPKMKIAEGEKITWPGAKQIFRFEKNGKYAFDIIGLADEELGGKKMLVQIFKNGKLIYNPPQLEEIREKVKANLKKLPEKYKRIKNPSVYPVKVSEKLKNLREELRKKLGCKGF